MAEEKKYATKRTLEQQAEESALWKEYLSDKSGESLERLICLYTGFVKTVAYRVLRCAKKTGTFDAEDLFQCGIMGLLQMIGRFDSESGHSFITFCTFRVRGEMIDFMRNNNVLKRGLYLEVRRARAFSQAYFARHGKYPPAMTVASGIKVSHRNARFCQLLDVNSNDPLRAVKSDMREFSKQARLLNKADRKCLDVMIEEEFRMNLHRKVRDARMHALIDDYYWGTKSLGEIGEDHGLSESRMCQINKTFIEKLRQCADMKEYFDALMQ